MREKLIIIGAGGTIDKIYGEGLGVTELSFSVDPAAGNILRKVKAVNMYPIVRVLAKDSMHMNEADRSMIAEMCASVPYDAILLTHGTDTMKETASVIAAKKIKKTIVLTGAGQPAVMQGTDADFNVGFALSAAMLAPEGVHIAMNACLYAWDKCVKNASGVFVPT